MSPARDASRPAAQSSTARIRGRILAADTGRPVGRAQVTLSGSPAEPRRTLTDADGRYEFNGLPAGSFSVSASKTGYGNLQYGQRRPFEPGTPVAVAGGRTVDRIDISLPRGAVIAVRVTDDLGDPMAGVEVRAQRFQYRPDGQQTLTAIYGTIPGPNVTDDRGELRVFGLMPGEYLVSAVTRSAGAAASSEGFAPTFYPGVISPGQAAPVSVQIGEETAVQFSMATSRLARVSGVVVDSQGQPANSGRVTLGSTANPGAILAANAAADGTFAIEAVPPGEYGVLTTSNTVEEALATLTVAGVDISDLRIVLSPGTTVSGRLLFEGGSPPAGAMSPFRVVLEAANAPLPLAGVMSRSRTAAPDAEGRFGFTGISGRILVGATAPEGWMMKSVVVNGDDVTGAPLDLGDRVTLPNVVITLTNRLTRVSGQVSDARAQPVRDYVAVIVPAETYEVGVMARRVRAIRPGPEATFTTQGVMPGRYLAVAVEGLEDGRQFSPEFQQHVRRLGQEFILREGETATLNLRLTPDLR